MRILELDLIAFGPFSGERIDLSGEGAGLHIVYGLNEAGKSSALRALGDLLYGIPEKSPDGFRHGYPSMRIGGRLRHSGGEALAFVRKKGRKGTLLSPEGEVLEDDALASYLGGVDAQQFAVQFGLSHEALVRGAEHLLKERGDAGESIFTVGTGLVGLRRVMRELAEEAEELYRPRGSAQAIARGIKVYGEARHKVRELSVSAHAWDEHNRALREAQEGKLKLEEEARALGAERERLMRLKWHFRGQPTKVPQPERHFRGQPTKVPQPHRHFWGQPTKVPQPERLLLRTAHPARPGSTLEPAPARPGSTLRPATTRPHHRRHHRPCRNA